MNRAEIEFMSGRSASRTLESRYNRDVFHKLCQKFNLPTTGTKKALIERLMSYVSQLLLQSPKIMLNRSVSSEMSRPIGKKT